MMSLKRSLLAVAVVAGTLPLLQGCFPLVATGVVAGTLMAADRRVSENYISDEAIENRSLLRIGQQFGEKAHVNVTSFNLHVLITGEVWDEPTKAEIEKVVQSVPNVKSVSNELQVAPNSSLSARSNDGYITSKVKARFVEANRFSANNVKVVTEARVVYLLGLVTQAEGDAATDIARTTGGVAKVVRLFEYVTTEQAKTLESRQADPGTSSPAPQR
jgi:osmotically-inducible protein OsmY